MLPILFLFFIVQTLASKECQPVNYATGIVCVCTEEYCDEMDPIGKSSRGIVQVFTTTKSGKRFEKKEIKFNNGEPEANTWSVRINRNQTYQTIIGFGSMFSDATALNIGKLSSKLQKQIISDLFSDKGLEYSMARTSVAGNDFSKRAYSYDDGTEDWDLKRFSLAEEDTQFKIPQMKIINELAKNKPVKFFGSPFSAPGWLKTNNALQGGGILKETAGSKTWKTYANYILKWLQSYHDEGIDFWGMTVQNEPNTGFIGGWPWNTMGFTAEMERDFVKTDLGPTLEKGGWGPDKFNIMILDHNRDALPLWADVIFGDSEAAKYAKGVAVHWYSNWNAAAGPERLDQTHNKYPDDFILATEPCEVPFADAGSHLAMGFWHYSEAYAHDIIKDLNHWTQGWNGWNMVLDSTGGPNWARQGSIYSAQIVVDQNTKKYYKTPIYYAIGHFSKFLPPGSVRIATSPQIVDNKNVNSDAGLQATAFKRPDGGIVFIVINTMTQDQPFVMHDPDLGEFTMKVTPNSFNTWLYYP